MNEFVDNTIFIDQNRENLIKFLKENLKISINFDTKSIGGEYGYSEKRLNIILSLGDEDISESSTIIE